MIDIYLDRLPQLNANSKFQETIRDSFPCSAASPCDLANSLEPPAFLCERGLSAKEFNIQANGNHEEVDFAQLPASHIRR